jgi:hypothetical protein
MRLPGPRWADALDQRLFCLGGRRGADPFVGRSGSSQSHRVAEARRASPTAAHATLHPAREKCQREKSARALPTRTSPPTSQCRIPRLR